MLEIVHIHFPVIGSTNTWAKEHVKEWAENRLTLITASEQTGGRGRFTRHWVSPPEVNIYATFCFAIDENRSDQGHIPQLLALSTSKVLEKLNVHPKIKWPNDLMLNGKKMAGILSESVHLDGKRGLIIGIGININMSEEELDKIDRPATSLLAESGQTYAISPILEEIKNQFNQDLSLFLKEGFSPFWLDFASHVYHQKGDLIRFHDNQRAVSGTFESLEKDGSVSVKIDGKLMKFYAGEFIDK